jgi:hypothetical protein
MFPEWPRIITQYIAEKTKPQLIQKITELTNPNKYVKDFEADKAVMPDLILVSSRHLFRMPYSLHEKTALASIVLNKEELQNFQLTDANPLKLKVRNFIPDSKEGEASELLIQALDWYKENNKDEQQSKSKYAEFKPIKIEKLSEQNFPPCVKKILLGVSDGKKRGLFVLINFFRSLGMEKEEIEKQIELWNKKNETPLKQGYIKSQIIWSYKNKPIMPPNCKEFYQGVGVCSPDELCRLIKNPVNYVVRKNFHSDKYKKPKIKDNFKNSK